MFLVIVCGALLITGVVLAILWNGERLTVPHLPGADAPTRRHRAGLRYYVWWVSVFLVAATASSILVTGAGGRLVMRLLAVTSPQARGRLTEAGELVGFITLEGTLGYLLFGAIPFAFASALLYLLVEPWLPPGRLRGPGFGVLLLVTVSPFIDPLRSDNIDFDIVGPGWLAVLLFAGLAVLQGAFLAAVAGRLSRSLPLMSRRNWPATTVPLLPAVVLWPLGVLLALAGLVALAFPRLLPALLAARASRMGVLIGRILLAVALLAALPAFIASLVSIWAR
ncbi:hypothetical protein ASF40_00755 [Microbacterium sp. Leaf288]|uniref:hypothetical protein n=1 Tax=Microbacterium sp. Leaf288 TaxID=1736323 RepID=UPI0006FD283C|nr:hypothetical protein [Microbacterium sp. Leaf288]KQP73936.1 hypothetical protein ASF40_00755 [Microbacterium sp. Leaf288]